MRKLLVSCAAAGSLLLGAAGVAASQSLAEAATQPCHGAGRGEAAVQPAGRPKRG